MNVDRTQYFDGRAIDALASSLIPEDINDITVQAVKSIGNGNCLYNSASIIVKGKESISNWLRQETSTELYNNAHFYAEYITNHIKVNNTGILSDDSLFSSMLSEETVTIYDHDQSSNRKIKAIKYEAKLNEKTHQWSTFLMFPPLSTVIRRRIFSVYPHANMGLRPVYNSLIVPRESITQPDAYIMWSRENLDNELHFQPNHFVPLLKTDTDTVEVEDELLSQIDFDSLKFDDQTEAPKKSDDSMTGDEMGRTEKTETKIKIEDEIEKSDEAKTVCDEMERTEKTETKIEDEIEKSDEAKTVCDEMERTEKNETKIEDETEISDEANTVCDEMERTEKTETKIEDGREKSDEANTVCDEMERTEKTETKIEDEREKSDEANTVCDEMERTEKNETKIEDEREKSDEANAVCDEMKRTEKTETKIEDEREKSDEANAVCDEMKRTEKTETKIEDEREKSDEANTVCDEMERTEKTETKIEDEREKSDEANTVCDEMERTEKNETKIEDEREKSDEANAVCDEMKRTEKTETKIEDEREKSDEANAVCDEMKRTEKTETKIEDEREKSDEANTVCDEMERTEKTETKIEDEREKSDEANTVCDEMERIEKTETKIEDGREKSDEANTVCDEMERTEKTETKIEDEREKSDEANTVCDEMERTEKTETKIEDEREKSDEANAVCDEMKRIEKTETKIEDEREKSDEANTVCDEMERTEKTETKIEDEREKSDEANTVCDEMERTEKTETKIEDRREKSDEANTVCDEMERTEKTETKIEDETEISDEANTVCDEMERTETLNTKIVDEREKSDEANTACDEIERTEKTETQIKNNSKTVEVTFSTQTQINIEEEREKSDEEDEEDYPTQSKNNSKSVEVTFNPVKVKGKVKTSNRNALYRKILENIENSEIIHKEQPNTGKKRLNKSIPKIKLKEMKKKEQDSPENEDDNSDDTEEENEIILTENMHVDEIIDTKKIKEHKTLKKGERIHEDDATSSQANTKRKLPNASIPNMKPKKNRKKEQDSPENEDDNSDDTEEENEIILTENMHVDKIIDTKKIKEHKTLKKGERIHEDDATSSQANTKRKLPNASIPNMKPKKNRKKEQDSPENEDDNSDDTEEENEIILTENMHVDKIIDTKKIKEHKTLKKGEKLHEDDATSSQANTKRKLSNASIPNMKLKKKKKKEQDSLENEDDDENSDTEKKKIISTKNNRDDKKGERIYEDDAPLSKLSQAIQKRNTGSGKLKYNKIKKKEQDCFESEGDDTDVAEEENTIIFESDDEIDELNEDINENENEASSDEEETLDSILQWSQKSIPVRKPKFVGPLPGASTNFNLKNEATELEYFMKYLPENLFETMAINTNKYKPIYENFRNAKVLDFEQITTDDIRSFIACRMVMGVNVNPAVDDYWSSDPTLRNHFISKTLTRKRFRMISRYYHINDPTQDPTRLKKARNSDPLYKVNPLLTHLNKQCADLYNLNQEVSVDEAMIKFHGQHSGTIGAPFKPAKRGFRIFALADGHNGYISNFEVYLRKKEREVGLTQRVVEDLMATILGRNHIVFVDKFYTSTSLALSLLSKNTYISGSFNISRRNFPDDLKPKKGVTKKKDPVRSLQRGECLSRQTKDGKLVACVWKDSALVYNLNTCYNILINTTTAIRKHRVDGKWVQDTIPCPQPIREFNKYMGGVDTHDHIRSSYTTQRKSRIWWHYFTWFSVDLALSNSYLLWKVRHKGSHKSFQLEVAKQLVSQNVECKKIRTACEADLGPIQTLAEHTKTSFTGRPKVCMQCKRDGKRNQRNRFPETVQGCEECNIHIHEHCFHAYHRGDGFVRAKKLLVCDKASQTDAPTTLPDAQSVPTGARTDARTDARSDSRTDARSNTRTDARRTSTRKSKNKK